MVSSCRLTGHELFYAFADECDLLFSQLWKHRQGEEPGGRVFGNREIAFFIAEMFVGGLQVQRERIVQSSGDTVLAEMLLEGIPAFYVDDIQMVD